MKHGDAGGDERDLERDARAVDGAREDVAPEPVDAERVLGRRARSACRRRRAPPSSAPSGRACRRSRRSAARRSPSTISSTMKTSATIATLSRRSRRQNSCIGERAVIFCAPLASSTTTVWSSCLVDEPGGIAGAHERDLGAACCDVDDVVPPARRQFPGRAPRTFPLVLPCGAPSPRRSARRRQSVAAAAYVMYDMPDYDPCLGPDSSVG